MTALLVLVLPGCGVGDDADGQAPSVPTGLRATVLSPTRILLAWDAARANDGVTAYRVWAGGQVVARLGTDRQYTATGLSAGTNHVFAVQACNAENNCSELSASVSSTTAPIAPTLMLFGLLIDNVILLGRHDPVRNGVAYDGPPVDIGPYTVSLFAGQETVSLIPDGPLAPYTQLIVDSVPRPSAFAVTSDDTLVVRVDFAAYARSVLASTGLPLPYATQFIPLLRTRVQGGVGSGSQGFVAFGGPGVGGGPGGGIITCSDPKLPPVSYTVPCT